MDIDRPHFRTTSSGSSTAAAATATSELFICFTSRLSSSSSMKISKSILSPGRAARDAGPVSLSSSLSRRLRTNGSLKGGQASPFFNTTGKKRGCGFDNPEPSSPKVTCIGQVRVKTKKKVKQSRSLSKRRSGEVSFRKIEPQSRVDGDDNVCGQQQQQRYSNPGAHFLGQPQQECLPHRNQRWVHLPISICEALRTFGAEFSCLFPCRSSCSSTGEREKNEKQNGNENGCGAVFARWLVSVSDCEGANRSEIELVVGGGDEEEEEEAERVSTRTSRRHVFEDIEVKDDRIELKGQVLEREEEAARVSICIPPKNALLLMRCRSDPMKMAALANNRLSSDAAAFATARNENKDIEEEEEAAAEEAEADAVDGKDEAFGEEVDICNDSNDVKEISNEGEEKLEIEGDKEEMEIWISSEEMVEEKTEEVEILVLEGPQEALVVEDGGDGNGDGDGGEEVESNMSSFEALLEQENAEYFEDCCPIKDEVEEDTPICHLSPSTESDEEAIQGNETPPSAAMETASSIEHKEDSILENNEEKSETTTASLEPIIADEVEEETEAKSEQTLELVTCSSNEDEEKKLKKESRLLPECLLLMMCEPKLSMEVSKETWVCSTDFIRWIPERPRKAAKSTKAGEQEPVKRRLSMDSKPKASMGKNEVHQPPPMATMIEQKLVNAVGYEPFVLTRCKSEPMRTAAAKLIPESCFWKSVRKLEPHMGVGAARVGF